MNFWKALSKPIFILAPMEQVTDTVFRQIVASCGKPDVFFTEFASTDGICSPGKKSVEQRFQFSETERPIVAQIWGKNPQHFYETAKIVTSMKFDGIDINMGCPVKDVIKGGSCAALINNPHLAAEIIQATKDGAKSAGRRIPVSVKTRIGVNTIKTEEWLTFLLQQNLAAISVHVRTAKEQSQVPAHWDEFQKIVSLKNKINKDTIIIGNGDIKTRQQGRQLCEEYGLDGVMIGRGIFENIWVFNKDIRTEEITPQMRLQKLIEHIELFHKTWGNKKNFFIMRKFVKAYVNAFAGASDMRVKLMMAKNADELTAETKNILASLSYI